jgi:carbonic anhydrase
MVDNSRHLAEEREHLFIPKMKMEKAAKGQHPLFLMVSPAHKSANDCRLLGLGQGDAFWVTRLPKKSLLSSDESPFLFGAPAAYFCHFDKTAFAVITFESDDSDDVIQESMSAFAQKEHLRKLHLIGLQLGSKGSYQPVGKLKFSERVMAGMLTDRKAAPLETDERVLVVLCSDSRLLPPHTFNGVPIVIRTLGAFIPPYDDASPETQNLDEFLADWLEENASEKRIVVIAHGHMTNEAAVCGAAKASLNPSELTDELLQSIVERIGDDAKRADWAHDATPYNRAIAIARATRENLATYSAVHELEKRRLLSSEFIQLAFMDTVTGLLAPL